MMVLAKSVLGKCVAARLYSTKIVVSQLTPSSTATHYNRQGFAVDPETNVETAIKRTPEIDVYSATVEDIKVLQFLATPTQSGKAQARAWTIDFDTLDHGDRWENQLVGWKGSANIMQSIRMNNFATKEEAIRFAEKQGWEYHIKEPKFPKFKVKSYKANFTYNPNELRFIYTK
ncbi:NADH-ubiquinone oxidoreductase 21 kDa subunit, mitochondrial [Smittium mucronatum]|uniref:NADH dehydrogenase [ubiquinone] iron-sulfur protein 4, mitochondrial n=1 Tax=Smittium mucronatum TaxID=133383 RepID=A0A1R0GZP8_9FUNG|nr:NADH-ubiquinone oxidoreductase 21 kDa subunit, mitochondrial [Smittium mucronatum]